jgi:hypothetical protein
MHTTQAHHITTTGAGGIATRSLLRRVNACPHLHAAKRCPSPLLDRGECACLISTESFDTRALYLEEARFIERAARLELAFNRLEICRLTESDKPAMLWPKREGSNLGRADFRSAALPTELRFVIFNLSRLLGESASGCKRLGFGHQRSAANKLYSQLLFVWRDHPPVSHGGLRNT